VRAGYARADVESVHTGGHKVEVVRVTITDVGRRALRGARPHRDAKADASALVANVEKLQSTNAKRVQEEY
jgi:hypothetical protein